MNVLDGRDSYLRTIAQLSQERAAAKPVVESICADGKEIWDVDIPEEWRTAGFVQELTAAASAIVDSDPRMSLNLAQFALAIATSIPSNRYATPIQAQIEGNAWKEIGTAHKYMSEYDASLRAYDSASRAFAGASSLSLDEAVIDFARAIVFVDLDKCEEALALLEKIDPIFAAFEDTRRLMQVKVLRGNICTRQHRWREAREIYETLLREVSTEDLPTRALLYQNLGVTCMELNLLSDSVLMFHNARQIFVELGSTIELHRCDWAIARLRLLNGEFTHAAPMLFRVRRFFLEKGLAEEAGLAGLDLADASIALAAVDHARELVAQILSEFTAAKLNSQALTALAYLRDILATTPEPTTAIRHVRHYLDRLQTEPELLFLPLPE
jgi:hypothetical protein